MDSYIPAGCYIREDADGERIVPKTQDRVTLRATDAIVAYQALRTSIENLDELLSRKADAPLAEIRQEKWESYQRVAKALGLKPTLTGAKT